MSLKEIFDKSLYLLGAGATCEADCLTSIKMLDDLSKKINNIGDIVEQESFYFLRSCLEYQNKWKNLKTDREDYCPNIEEFVFLLRRIIKRDNYLPYPLIGNWNEKILKLETKNEYIFKTLLNRIENDYLKEWLRFDEKKQSILLKPLKAFFSQTSDQNFIINIFTLNYDTVFESFFNDEGETLLNDGFVSEEWCDNFGQEKLEKHDSFRINYYKLHGSLNWKKDENSGQVSRNVEYKRHVDNPLIIFGQETKMLSIDPFLSLIYRFKRMLEQIDYFFILGYSFFDTYINNLILEALSKNTDKRIIIINPNVGDKRTFIEKLKNIQSEEFNDDVYNIKNISPERIEILPMKASLFFKEYFESNAQKLSKLIQQKLKPLEPF